MSRFGASRKRTFSAAVPRMMRRRAYKSRINRRQSGVRIRFTPLISVIAICMLPLLLPFIPHMPLLPPFGLMVFISWQLLRPGVWPLWIGFPLGLLDDLTSGQPLGSGALIWSVILLMLDIFDQRMLFKDYVRDWLLAAAALMIALLGGAYLNRIVAPPPPLHIVLPQLVISILVFPITVRIVAALDRWRLAR